MNENHKLTIRYLHKNRAKSSMCLLGIHYKEIADQNTTDDSRHSSTFERRIRKENYWRIYKDKAAWRPVNPGNTNRK